MQSTRIGRDSKWNNPRLDKIILAAILLRFRLRQQSLELNKKLINGKSEEKKTKQKSCGDRVYVCM